MYFATSIGFLFVFLLFSSVGSASNVDSLLLQIDQSRDLVEKTELYIKIGDINEHTNPEKAIDFYQKAYQTATSLGKGSSGRSLNPDLELLRAKSLRYIGIVYSNHGDFEKALEYYQNAMSILEEQRTRYTTPFRNQVHGKMAKVLNNIGIVYSRQGIFKLARDYYSQALEMYREAEDSASIAVIVSSIGIVEARQANLTEALKYFHQALDIYTANENQEGIAQSYNNIGGIHYQLENWDDALELYQKAHDAFLEMGHLQQVAAIKGNIGLVYKSKQEYEKAEEFLQAGLNLRYEIDDKGGIVESYNNLGGLATQIGNHAKANEYYHKAYDIASDIGDQRMTAMSLINIGTGYFQSQQINTAIRYTQDGLDLARKHGMTFVIQSALEKLAEYYAAAGNFKRAFAYSQEHYQLSQEILDEQKVRQINELEIEYQAREKQQRIEILEQEKELGSLQLRQSRTIAFVLGLLFLIGLIISVFVLILLKQRNKILILKKENEAQKAIQKTDNDLQAILKTHAYGMILFDNEINIIAFNAKANAWTEHFFGFSLQKNHSFFENQHPIIAELKNDVILESLKGFSKNIEKDILQDDKVFHFKFFSNPVFEENDELIQSVSLMIEDVTETRKTQEKMLNDLREKETLIKEIHHRVKNNMQVIISLLRLQSYQLSSKAHQDAFRELEQRITAMSYVHEDLYKSHNLSDIRFEEYIRKISSNLGSLYNKPIKVYNHVEMNNPHINIDLAMPCGLVVNELLSNAFKHAFHKKDQPGNSVHRIDIYFTENPLNYELRVIDNGSGLEDGNDPYQSKTMGFHLIKVIVEEQLRGSWNVVSNDGLKVSVVFPKTLYSAENLKQEII